jgi:hypothetical protein
MISQEFEYDVREQNARYRYGVDARCWNRETTNQTVQQFDSTVQIISRKHSVSQDGVVNTRVESYVTKLLSYLNRVMIND